MGNFSAAPCVESGQSVFVFIASPPEQAPAPAARIQQEFEIEQRAKAAK
jgi:hypothetical protein